MKKYVILLLIAFQLSAYAEQIPLGINTNKLFAWSIWENTNGVLKHYLYLNNSTQKEIKLVIRLKKYKNAGNEFEEVKTDKEIYKVFLPLNRLTKIDYPTNSDKLSFMEFFADGKSVGLLNFNMEEPQRSFVDNKYKFYTNAGTGKEKIGMWMRFVNLYDAHTDVSIMSNVKNGTDVYLVKIVNPAGSTVQLSTKLDSLQQFDKSILKFDQVNNLYTQKLQGDFGANKFVLFPMTIQLIQGGKVMNTITTNIAVFKE